MVTAAKTKTANARPRIVLTPEQQETLKQIREEVERERPEIVAEGQRVFSAHEATLVEMRSAFALLKVVRKMQGVSLNVLAERTGMSKPALSRLENDPEPNVTLTTLKRVAEALGHELRITLVPVVVKPPPKKLRRVASV